MDRLGKKLAGKCPVSFLSALARDRSDRGNAQLSRVAGRSETASDHTDRWPRSPFPRTLLADILRLIAELGRPTHRQRKAFDFSCAANHRRSARLNDRTFVIFRRSARSWAARRRSTNSAGSSGLLKMPNREEFGMETAAIWGMPVNSHPPSKRLAARCINQFISISTFTRHIGEMVFDRRNGFWLGYFATVALTSGPCF